MKPVVAVIGRPNVGKSTFFNRVTRSKDALVDNWPGVTRDRHYGDAHWDGISFTMVDTGGFLSHDTDQFSQQIHTHVRQAIDDADAVVFLLDGKHGLTPHDSDIVTLLRRIAKPVFYVVNKIDGPDQEGHLPDFYDLGVSDFYAVSAEHGYGIRDLLDALVAVLPRGHGRPDSDNLIRLAVVGRPNVGKSSLVNQILGQQRLVVSDVPGTTRDAIDTECVIDGRRYVIIDTAGIRRKGKVTKKLEKFSIIKALKSLDRCDVALIVIDASEGITDQDISISGYAYERGCGCIFLLNKWDIVPKDHRTHRQFIEQLRFSAKFLQYAPALTISALTGQRVPKIFSAVNRVYQEYTTRVGTGKLNRIITDSIHRNEPSLHKGRRLKFYYTTQAATRPPTFVSFVNFPKAVHFSYRRYLINQIREATGLTRTPIRMFFRQRGQ
jgi:GTP-binding protein